MASVDKLFGNHAQYQELTAWLQVNYPDGLPYIYWEPEKGYSSIALFPQWVDAYLLAHCPLEWVVEQIRGQYCLDMGGKPPNHHKPVFIMYCFDCEMTGTPIPENTDTCGNCGSHKVTVHERDLDET